MNENDGIIQILKFKGNYLYRLITVKSQSYIIEKIALLQLLCQKLET